MLYLNIRVKSTYYKHTHEIRNHMLYFVKYHMIDVVNGCSYVYVDGFCLQKCVVLRDADFDYGMPFRE